MPDFEKPDQNPNPFGGAPGNPDPWGSPQQGAPPQGIPGWGQPAPPPEQQQWGGGAGGPLIKKTPDQAIMALILGIAGLTMCPLICSIPAIILGKQAMNQVDTQPQLFAGRGIGQTGYVLGIIGTALSAVVALIFLVAIVASV